MMLMQNGQLLNGADTEGKSKPQTSNLGVAGSSPAWRAKIIATSLALRPPDFGDSEAVISCPQGARKSCLCRRACQPKMPPLLSLPGAWAMAVTLTAPPQARAGYVPKAIRIKRRQPLSASSKQSPWLILAPRNRLLPCPWCTSDLLPSTLAEPCAWLASVSSPPVPNPS